MVRFLNLASLVLALTGVFALPVDAETLSVLRGDVKAAIRVSVGGEKRVISLSDYCEIVVADPSIADIASDGPRTILVNGVEIGRTTLTLFDCEDTATTIVELMVVPEPAPDDMYAPVYAPKMLAPEYISVVKNAAESVLRIETSVSVILLNDRSVAGFEIDDRTVADAATLSESGFYVLGKTVGITTMQILHAEDAATTTLTIEVIGAVDKNS